MRTIKDVMSLQGKKVLLRCDLNVPIKNGIIADDTRIVAALPTINYILGEGASIVLCSHLGRPKGEFNLEYSLKPVAEYLKDRLNLNVIFANDVIGNDAQSKAQALKAGEILLLENLRFHAEEENNDATFAKKLASLADVYVNDAFGAAHRAHASTAGVANYLPAYSGFLMEQEITELSKVCDNPERPFIAILGGAKVDDKLPLINNLLNTADKILLGGKMANDFNNAIVSDKIVLPIDTIDGKDIGMQTIGLFKEEISKAKTIFWNGPLGMFEDPKYANGTNSIAKALGESGAITIVGGGDVVSAVKKSGYSDKFTHISTGGGASIEFLEGKTLPGVECLMEKVNQ